MEQLVGSHVGQDKADNLRRVEVLGHLDCFRLGHTNAFRVRTPDCQCCNPIPYTQPGTSGAELLYNAHELVTGRKRRLRDMKICASPQLRIRERHTGCQHPDSDLAGAGPRILGLYHLQDLRTTESFDNDAFHGSNISHTSSLR
ncbi:hypothetical protein NicSoilB4_15050 [Arthrobacter sp. NicSoilB4]|nr:hypothetical protein NicSoilB4_15050 [Arthrobacter sp. NicSoilB4]